MLPTSGSRDDLGKHADNKQIAANKKDRQGCAQDGMGRIDVDFGEAAPNDCHHDQCAPDQERHRIDIADGQARRRKRAGPG